jgi:hypothetical protein
MDQHFFAGVEDRLAQRHRRELRVAAGVVGDRDPINGIAVREIGGEGPRVPGLAVGHRAAGGHQLDAE